MTKLTVLMPVYNAELYIKEAVDSILSQTFSNFEFLIFNDGSTDRSADFIRAYNDSRIKFFDFQQNHGLVHHLNNGMAIARGQYIARMDADDISLPNRLMQQVRFMDDNPDIIASGAWMKSIGISEKVLKYPTEPDIIRAQMIFDCPIAHPTVILRREVFVASYCYSDNYEHTEDYELWIRISKNFKISNLDQVILLYRRHHSQVTHLHNFRQRETSLKLQITLLENLCIIPTKSEIRTQKEICDFSFQKSEQFLEKAHEWLIKLRNSNQVLNVYPVESFQKVLAHKWFQICLVCTNLGFQSWNKYWKSPLIKNNYFKNYKDIISFAIKCGIKFKHKNI